MQSKYHKILHQFSITIHIKLTKSNTEDKACKPVNTTFHTTELFPLPTGYLFISQ